MRVKDFSQTWFPHLWRIKCEPLVDSEEFSQILQEPINQDNYLGVWDITKPYPEGYIISYGDKNYISIADVPAGTNPPNTTYWRLTEEQNLKDILGTYNRNIAINNANLEEAKRLLPKSGYDNSNLYIVPTYGEYSSDGVLSGKNNQPAPPINVITSAASTGAPSPVVEIFTSTEYVNDSPYLRIPAATIAFIKNNILDVAFPGIPSAPVPTNVIASSTTESISNQTILLSAMSFAAPMTEGGSGSLQAEIVLTIDSMMTITGPYGTADNTYSTADQNPEAPGFTDEITPVMDFRADCDPRFQFIARSSPRTFGYTTSYLSGDGQAPNGFPTGAGISFPQNPQVGDYFLRIDYLPQLLYRWDGQLWVRISENVRTDTGLIDDDKTQTASFINNSNVTVTTSGTVIPQKQALSTMLTIAPDPLPPVA
jgi:hypothetical protein